MSIFHETYKISFWGPFGPKTLTKGFYQKYDKRQFYEFMLL